MARNCCVVFRFKSLDLLPGAEHKSVPIVTRSVQKLKSQHEAPERGDALRTYAFVSGADIFVCYRSGP